MGAQLDFNSLVQSLLLCPTLYSSFFLDGTDGYCVELESGCCGEGQTRTSVNRSLFWPGEELAERLISEAL